MQAYSANFANLRLVYKTQRAKIHQKFSAWKL